MELESALLTSFIERARTVLGHSTASTTKIDTKADRDQVFVAVAKIGVFATQKPAASSSRNSRRRTGCFAF